MFHAVDFSRFSLFALLPSLSLTILTFIFFNNNRYGVFPLRGKMLNVRDANHKQLMENQEINHIATILGLSYEKDYADPNNRELRYGKIMLMTDQDHDGMYAFVCVWCVCVCM